MAFDYLTEKQFLSKFSEKQYQDVVRKAYEEVKKSPEFKNDKPEFASLLVFPCYDNIGQKFQLVVEVTAIKKQITPTLRVYDFGIVRLAITDEDMPDEVLDRYNEYKKVKDDIFKQDRI